MRELAHRIVELEHGNNKGKKAPCREAPWWLIRSRPISSNSAMAIEPRISISGELMANAATSRRFARNSRRAAARKRATSQFSMPNALTIRFPVMVSCRMFWISASLSCPPRVVVRTCRPIFLDEYRITGTNSSSTHASFPPTRITTAAVKTRVKNCCRNSASTLDMANCTFSTSLTMVESSVPVVCLRKNADELRRMALYKVVPQVGDHAKTGVVHEVGSNIVEDPLQHRGGHQRKGNNRPWIVKVRRHQLLEIENATTARQFEQLDRFFLRSRIQYAIKNWAGSAALGRRRAVLPSPSVRPKPEAATRMAQRSALTGSTDEADGRRGFAGVPSLFAPATVEVAMPECQFYMRDGMPAFPESLPLNFFPKQSAQGERRTACPLPRTVPMHDFHFVSSLPQPLVYVLGDHHRAMLSAGASETDGQVTLAFANIVGQ